MPTETFRSHGAMMRNLAFRNMNGIPVTATTICVGKGKDAKCHRVKPSQNPERIKIDNAQRAKVKRRKEAAKKAEARKRTGRKR